MSSAAADRLPATRPPLVVACLKLVDSRPDVDPLSAAVRTDARSAGPSPADEAALEWALRLGRAWGLATVAVSAGGPAADPMLRDALAAGATGAWRVDVDADAPSADVAAAVAEALRPHPALVVCGAWSLDRGSGAFPAFLAAELGWAQALGLVELAEEPHAGPRALRAVRRLDGGRREVLATALPAVISLEASTARLRRASLGGVLAARGAAVTVVAGPSHRPRVEDRVTVGPFRPRARVLPAPDAVAARDRVLALTGAGTDRPPARVVTLEPGAAADAILEQLRSWGYLP